MIFFLSSNCFSTADSLELTVDKSWECGKQLLFGMTHRDYPPGHENRKLSCEARSMTKVGLRNSVEKTAHGELMMSLEDILSCEFQVLDGLSTEIMSFAGLFFFGGGLVERMNNMSVSSPMANTCVIDCLSYDVVPWPSGELEIGLIFPGCPMHISVGENNCI